MDSHPWGLLHFQALTVMPSLAVAVWQVRDELRKRQGTPGALSDADHEMIDQVLGLDSGYLKVLVRT